MHKVNEEEKELNDKKTPTPCLWQAPASAQKTKRKTRPAIRRSARRRAKEGRRVGSGISAFLAYLGY